MFFAYSKMSKTNNTSETCETLNSPNNQGTSTDVSLANKTPTKNRTPKKRPSNQGTSTEEPSTKKPLCSITNVSNLITSPSKIPGKKPTMWFEFGVTTASNKTKKRVSCFNSQMHEYLTSQEMESVVYNPTKGIIINNLTGTDHGFTMTKFSSFGDIEDLPNPFETTAAKIVAILDCLYKMNLDDIVSIRCKLLSISMQRLPARNSAIYAYKVTDGKC